MFRFRLQKLLQYRRRLSDEAKHELLLADRRLAAARSDLDDARARRTALDLGHRSEESGPMGPIQLACRLAQTQRAIAQEGLARHRFEQASAERQQRQEELSHRHRESRLLERLQERRRHEHEQEERAQERRELDDIGGRKRRSLASATATPAPRRR